MRSFLSGLFKNLVDSSSVGKLDLTDVKKLIRNALIVGAGASLAYLSTNVVGLDLGTSTAILVPLFSMGIDALYKLFKDNVKVVE